MGFKRTDLNRKVGHELQVLCRFGFRHCIASRRVFPRRCSGNGCAGGGELFIHSGVEESAELREAREAFSEAEDAVRAAVAASRAAAGAAAFREQAKRLIADARAKLVAAVEAAEVAVAVADGPTALGRATRALDRARGYRNAQETVLMNARASFAWYRRNLVRHTFANGDVAVPREGTNVAMITRIPRTIPTSATDSTPKANPDAFTSATFKDVMYADDKRVFSVIGGDDEFKVDGYVGWRASSFGVSESMHTGLKLTTTGLVIRTGGTGQDIPYIGFESGFISDYTDTRRNITTWANDGDGDGVLDVLYGQNGWDLEIAFDEPQTRSAGSGDTSWTGNGDFYWKSLVPADPSQLDTQGDHYDPRAFGQPDGFKDLGTYEVWLSNHLGVANANLEPVEGSGVVVCADGSRGTSCPDDDTHHYLKYAAYGLFVYAPDLGTFRGSGAAEGFNGHLGRTHTLHFGYAAFGTEEGQKTADIGEAIAGGEFHGHALALEILGDQNLEILGDPELPEIRDSAPVQTGLLRGDVALIVSIPKESGLGSVEGTISNFQQWSDRNKYWAAYVDDFTVVLTRTVISESGTFGGKLRTMPRGGVFGRGAGNYKGNLYGPRADANDLEIAGSWVVNIGQRDDRFKDIYGSFGAKQRPTGTPEIN